jgi:spoIIIJ-associated protein
MDIEETLQDTLEQMLIQMGMDYNKVKVEADIENDNNYFVKIQSDTPGLLIGYRGESIQALQQILKVIAWKKHPTEKFNILLDVDDYRVRQDEKVMKLAERKIQMARKTGKAQVLPPMRPYYRRKIHLFCMDVGYEDIETYSEGAGDKRQVIIKLKK